MKTTIKLFGTIAILSMFMACSERQQDGEYETSLFSVKTDGKWGYVNHKGEYVINPQFEEASLFTNGLAQIKVDGKIGFINEKGEMVLSPQYNSATMFHDGKAWVVRPDNAPELIDKKGEVILEYKKGRIIHSFSEGLSIVYDDNDNYWVINEKGETIFSLPEKHIFFSNYTEGLAVVRNKKDYGYVDKDGKIVINCQFDYAKPFKNGKAIVKQGDMYGVIDKEGKYVINPQFKAMMPDEKGYVVRVGDKFGWCDEKGKLVINPQFDLLMPYNGNDMTPVALNSKIGFADKEGKYVINPQFNDATPVFDDIMWVQADDKWGIINKKGEYIANPQFDKVSAYSYINPFYEYAISEYFDVEGISTWIASLFTDGKFDGIKVSETSIKQFREKYKIGDRNAYSKRYSRDMNYTIIANGTFQQKVSNGWWGPVYKLIPDAKLDYIHLQINLSNPSKYGEVYGAVNKALAIKDGRTSSGLYTTIEQGDESLSIYVSDKPFTR